MEHLQPRVGIGVMILKGKKSLWAQEAAMPRRVRMRRAVGTTQ